MDTLMGSGLDATFIEKILYNMQTVQFAALMSTLVILLMGLLTVINVFRINVWGILASISTFTSSLAGKRVYKKENNFDRQVRIGIYNEKTKRVKNYKFLNDLIIDLGLKKKGATPYSFLFALNFLAFIFSVIIAVVVFSNYFMTVFVFPLMLIFLLCSSYTVANISRDRRIDSVIEAENAISNSIKNGVVVAVRSNVDMIDEHVREAYKQFIESVDVNNVHIKIALLELNNNLGSISDDFVKKCIIFEFEEEDGSVGVFQDVVEINNLKIELRNDMRRKFEQINTKFILSATMILIFLAGIMAYYPFVRNFYLNTMLGQLIILVDMLILVLEYVYLTFLKAKQT